MAELVIVRGLLRMLETVDREILNAGSSPVLTTSVIFNYTDRWFRKEPLLFLKDSLEII